VGGLLAGDMGLLRWSEPKRCYDFYDAKGDLEALFAYCHVETYAFKPDKHPALHPGKSARIIVAGIAVGWLGALHPRLMDVFDLTTEVFVFELAFPALLNRQRSIYRAVSKYPQVRRDLALLVDESIGFSEIAHVIREAVPVELLKALDVFDEYFDAALFPGKKSIAVALTLQHDGRTLLDNEINLLFAAILKLLDDKLEIGLRD
jgi:phenylalanyl-tRNA synthetase beta chain